MSIESYSFCPFGSGAFHITWCFQGSFILWHVSGLHPFSWLSHIPLHAWTTLCLFICWWTRGLFPLWGCCKKNAVPLNTSAFSNPQTVCWLVSNKAQKDLLLVPRESCLFMNKHDMPETEDETVGWHHWLDGHEFEQTPGIGDGQGNLACCSPWGHKKSDTTERLNWTELPGIGREPRAWGK